MVGVGLPIDNIHYILPYNILWLALTEDTVYKFYQTLDGSKLTLPEVVRFLSDNSDVYFLSDLVRFDSFLRKNRQLEMLKDSIDLLILQGQR